MSSELAGDMVFDTSVLLELFNLTPVGILIKGKLVSNHLRVHVSEISLSEITYILCRRVGYVESVSKVRLLADSGYIEIEQTSELLELAAKYKCERSLSIADCFALALGKHLNFPVVFSRREQELSREIERKSFDVELIFLKG